VKVDKHAGRLLKEEDLEVSIREYFIDCSSGMLRRGLVPLFLEKIEKLQAIFKQQQALRFYSSSLLFVYDALDEDHQEVDLRMIDFAKSYTNDDPELDHGYLLGLSTIKDVLLAILRDGPST
jgi:inositol-hexakisphosphate 5-kinase